MKVHKVNRYLSIKVLMKLHSEFKCK